MPLSMDQLKSLIDGLLEPGYVRPRRSYATVRVSKHAAGRAFKATKAYKDDRQKAPWNRRRKGRRKRRH